MQEGKRIVCKCCVCVYVCQLAIGRQLTSNVCLCISLSLSFLPESQCLDACNNEGTTQHAHTERHRVRQHLSFPHSSLILVYNVSCVINEHTIRMLVVGCMKENNNQFGSTRGDRMTSRSLLFIRSIAFSAPLTHSFTRCSPTASFFAAASAVAFLP